MSSVLLIAGCDSSGGAGLTRDVRTLTQLGARALCAVTAVTAQSDHALSALQPMPAELVRAQIAAAFATREVDAIKIGMLATTANVEAVAESLPLHGAPPVVLDPVLLASSGGALLEAGAVAALRAALMPRVTLITPNIPEAAALLGMPMARSDEQLLRQGEALLALGARAVLLKGGHGSGAQCTDLLFSGGQSVLRFSAPRSATLRRGSGCALASAIAAGLAARLDLQEACARAKQYMTEFFQHGN